MKTHIIVVLLSTFLSAPVFGFDEYNSDKSDEPAHQSQGNNAYKELESKKNAYEELAYKRLVEIKKLENKLEKNEEIKDRYKETASKRHNEIKELEKDLNNKLIDARKECFIFIKKEKERICR